MKNTTLVLVLAKISLKEFKLFEKFVASTYWNSNEEVNALVSILIKHHPFSAKSSLNRERLWEQTFPNTPFDYDKLRILFSQVLRLFETFITIESVRQDESGFELKILDELAERDYPARFKKKRDKIEKEMAVEKKRDRVYFRNKSELLSIADRYNTSKNDYSKRVQLEERSRQLDIYYYIEKLSTCCELLNRSLFFKDEYNHPEMELLEQHIESHPNLLESSSVLKIYYWIYLTLRSPEMEEIYFQLKEELKNAAPLFSRNEYRDVHLYILNYVSRRINSGKKVFLKESFELLKVMMEGGMLMRDGKLEEAHYKNFITTGIRNNEFDYLEYFIKNYTQFLSDDVRDNAYSYNMANLFYSKGDYEKAQSLLLQVEYSDINYNLDSKALLLRIYFDADEDQALYAHISTVKIYLLRNKLINSNKYRRYHQLFRFTNSLYKIKENIGYDSEKKTQEKLQKLESQIQKVKAIANKQWLTEKLNELKKDEVLSE